MAEMLAPQQKVANVRTMLEKLRPQIAMALPRHMTPDRLSRVAMTAIMRTPRLLDCDQTSLAGAIITCAQLGLEPDPLLGHAYLVPFRNRKRGVVEVTVIAGYRGLMKLARNSGEIATIDAKAVHQKDKFKYVYGIKPVLEHTPYQGSGDPGPATHYYAVAVMKSGAGQFIVLTKGEVEAHRNRFVNEQNIKDPDSPWSTDFDAMAMKTAIRMLAKFLPASVELQKAAALDELAEAGIPQDLGAIIDLSAVEVPVEAPGAAGSKLDKLATAMEGQVDQRPQGGGQAEPEKKTGAPPAAGGEGSQEAIPEPRMPSARAQSMGDLLTMLTDSAGRNAGDLLRALTKEYLAVEITNPSKLTDEQLGKILGLGDEAFNKVAAGLKHKTKN